MASKEPVFGHSADRRDAVKGLDSRPVVPALPPDHHVPRDADAGGEVSLAEAEAGAHSDDSLRQPVEAVRGTALARHGQFFASR